MCVPLACENDYMSPSFGKWSCLAHYEIAFVNYVCDLRGWLSCYKRTEQAENTALIYAASKGFSDCVRLLMENGANIHASGNIHNAWFSDDDEDGISIDSVRTISEQSMFVS
jgi:hypothetical protein